jgi:hypothetical protein
MLASLVRVLKIIFALPNSDVDLHPRVRAFGAEVLENQTSTLELRVFNHPINTLPIPLQDPVLNHVPA